MSQEETVVEETSVVDAAIKQAFVSAINDGKEPDSIKIAMIGAGASFKNVNRLFNAFMVEDGHVVSKEEKDSILSELLDGLDLTDSDTFESAIVELAQRLQVSELSSVASIRQWAKKNDLPFYKKAKAESKGERSSITSDIFNWISENPSATEDQLVEFLKEVGTDNTMKHASLYKGILGVANKIVANNT